MTTSIAETLGIRSERSLSLLGGGGKTSLMFRLAREFTSVGERVITTTTTKIGRPGPEVSPVVFLDSNGGGRRDLLDGLERHSQVTVAHAALNRWKLDGVAPEIVDDLVRDRVADRVINEADGSKGRSIKAHASYEPVVPSGTDLAVVVIGIDCIGAPLDGTAVHRPELFAERVGQPIGTPVTIDAVAAIVHHPQGYLAQVPPECRVAVLFNKVDAPLQRLARDCAAALFQSDSGGRIDRVLCGAIRDESSQWLLCKASLDRG